VPIIADFTVIQDTAVTLTNANPVHIYPAFDAPAVSAGSRAVLVFRVSPDIAPVTLELDLNGPPAVLTETFGTTPQRGYHEIVEPNVVVSAGNILTISKPGAGGQVTVRDVYLLFQAIV
jgi:hypothetical protein